MGLNVPPWLLQIEGSIEWSDTDYRYCPTCDILRTRYRTTCARCGERHDTTTILFAVSRVKVFGLTLWVHRYWTGYVKGVREPGDTHMKGIRVG